MIEPPYCNQAGHDEIARLRAENAELRGAFQDIRAALEKLPPGEWEVWTSNSFRRITAKVGARHQQDGGVLRGTVQRSDGHPDLSMNEEQLDALCAVINLARAAIALQEPQEPPKPSGPTSGS